MKNKKRRILLSIYKKLYTRFGPQGWWPARGAFEVMIGAILTQNTAWPNVEKAIVNLKRDKLLSVRKMLRVPSRNLKAYIRPSGFYNEKAKKLKTFVKFLSRFCNGDINRLRVYDTERLRKEFLNIKGVGPETADSMLLYALNRPVFVVDAYTKRVFLRHKLISGNAGYDETQDFFMSNLPKKVKLFNE